MSSPNDSRKITTIEDLHHYLHTAMQIEHATIPPYLLALYSIHPGTNSDATSILRVVAIEEMLHLTLAANILNAVGGTPDLTDKDFVQPYPTPVPTGEKDFWVHLQPFSQEAVKTFLKIERPSRPRPGKENRFVPRPPGSVSTLLAVPGEVDMYYYSIGEFYEEIVRGLNYLHKKVGDKLFIIGDPARQVTPDYYYSGGGELFPVTDLESALRAANLIKDQGEGYDGTIYDNEKPYELAHFYRFEQLLLGKYYQPGDKPYERGIAGTGPTGAQVEVQWDAVYRFKTDAQLSDYAESPELYAAAKNFNQSYADFLRLLTTAYNGKPQLLSEALPQMFTLRNGINQLIHNPIPGTNDLAAPTFEMAGVTAKVRS